MELKKKRVIYWHPAFYADIQIELRDEADKLTFENEHHLSKKPMQIDVLIIKKENLWLKSLTNNLKGPENARKLMEDYQKNQENTLYQSALDAILRANEKMFREVNGMSIEDTFMEFVQEKFDRKLKEETEKAVKAAEKKAKTAEKKAETARLAERISLIQKKCAKNKPLSVIAQELETESDEVLPIYNIITQNPGKTVEEICELVI